MQFIGHPDITDDLNLVNSVLIQDPSTKVINLDSDTHFDNPNVIGGAQLLPPPEAVIAMVDQDEDKFNMIYYNYFNCPDMQKYVTIIIAYLYKKGNLLFYTPYLRDQADNTLIVKFLNMMYDVYGIGIGVINQNPCNYNIGMELVWNNLLYSAMIIPVTEFLFNHPIGIQIEIPILEMVKQDLNPYLFEIEESEKEKHIYDLVRKLKEKPNLKFPIGRIYC